jgi:hypothetical protein
LFLFLLFVLLIYMSRYTALHMTEFELIENEKEMVKKDKKKKRGYHRIDFHMGDEMRQVFIGHHTIFSVLGFTVGGMLIGGVLERIFIENLGHGITIFIGLILLFVSGFILKIFNE